MDSSQAINTIYLLFIGSVGMVLMAGATVFFFTIYYKRNIRAKEEMYAMEINHRQQVIYSNLRTLEDERKRFAEDLHDEIGASLSTIRLHVSRLESVEEESEFISRLREVKEVIDLSMASTRRISHNMLPPKLKMLGLSHAVEDLCKQISEASDLKVRISISSSFPRIGYNTELTVYRIIQELLNNTIKHAGATEVLVKFTLEENIFTLLYSDNGKGFDAGRNAFAGLGMSNIQSRAEMVNGSFQLSTSPGKGLTAEIKIPSDHPHDQ